MNGPLDTVATEIDATCNYVHVAAGPDVGLEAQIEKFWNIDTGHVLEAVSCRCPLMIRR